MICDGGVTTSARLPHRKMDCRSFSTDSPYEGKGLARIEDIECFSEEISEMGGEILAPDEAEGTGNIRSDLSRARLQSPVAKDPDPLRKFVLRTALMVKTLKIRLSGCATEQSKLRTTERLTRLISVFCFLRMNSLQN